MDFCACVCACVRSRVLTRKDIVEVPKTTAERVQVGEVETAMRGWNVKTKYNVSDINILTSACNC